LTETEEYVKRLADMKAYLERMIREHNEEISRLRSFLEVIDSILAERSFRKVTILPEPCLTKANHIATPSLSAATQITPVLTAEGVHLGDFITDGRNLKIVPDPNMKFQVNSPPLRAFLINRVLEPMQARDREAVSRGEMAVDQAMVFRIDEQGGILKEVYISNYADERRLNEIKNAAKWAFRRMYEKSAQVRQTAC
jgi:hypothetical protein